MPKQRDIVLIAVPYSDLSATKQRPVLILSSDAHLRRSPDMLAVTITSNLNASMIGVIFDTTEMEAGNLPRQSLIRADKVHNLRQGSIIKTFGVLNKPTFAKVLAELDTVLGR